MKKPGNTFFKNLRYICFIGVIALGLITIVGSNGGDGEGGGNDEGGDSGNSENSLEYRQDMRDFVQGISSYAKGINSNFIVIPQNGHELLTENGEETGTPAVTYVEAIDGVGREDLFYGYDDDNVATPASERNYMIAFMDIAEDNGVEVLVTDYCWNGSFMDDSYSQNNAK